MKKLKNFIVLLILTFSVNTMASFGSDDDKKDISKEIPKVKIDKDCEIPAFAKAIGHEYKWLLHNGCLSIKGAKKDEFRSSYRLH